MRAGPDGQLGAGADGAGLGLHQDLIGGRRWQLHLADLDTIRFTDDSLQRTHGSEWAPRGQWAGRGSRARRSGQYRVRNGR